MVKNKDKTGFLELTQDEKKHLEKSNAKFIKPMKSECEVLDILGEQ